jgi:uncharacterized protein YlxP (DUF503 family)
MDYQDKWSTSGISCAVISNDAVHCQQVLQEVLKFFASHFRDAEIIDYKIEII